MNQIEKKRWMEEGGREKQHTFEGIDANSIVFDIGAYKGDWARRIAKKYDAYVYAFEPITKFYNRMVRSLATSYPKIKFFNFGLGANTRTMPMAISDDSSSMFALKKDTKCQTVAIKSIKNFIQDPVEIEKVDLASINIQGAEYELMNFLFSTSLISKFIRILLQFHEYKDIGSLADREKIRKSLSLTHNLIYSYDTVWDYWIKKE